MIERISVYQLIEDSEKLIQKNHLSDNKDTKTSAVITLVVEKLNEVIKTLNEVTDKEESK